MYRILIDVWVRFNIAMSVVVLVVFVDCAEAIIGDIGDVIPEKYIAEYGSPIFGIDHSGIANIRGKTGHLTAGSGALLESSVLTNRKYVLTAAHILWGYDPSIAEVVIEIGDGQFAEYDISAVHYHPYYRIQADDDYDLAIVELEDPVLHGSVTGYYQYQPEHARSSLEVTFMGYGFGGGGLDGVDYTGQPAGVKRAAMNVWDGVPSEEFNQFPSDPPALITNPFVYGFWDFDAGGNGFSGGGPLSDHREGTAWKADSGGPVFQQLVGGGYSILGVIQGAFRTPASDMDAYFNGSYGEVGLFSSLILPDMHGFVNRIVGKRVDVRAYSSSTGWDDASTWAMGWSPDVDSNVHLSAQVADSYVLLGPAVAQQIASLSVGLSSGNKQLQMSNGGSLTMPGDITIDTNGSIVLETGTLSADSLVIQGTASVPQTPTPSNGFFIWSDQNGLGTSSLIVNRIEVGHDGAFEYRWANQSTQTFSTSGGGYVDVDVLAGGLAIFEMSNDDLGDLTNSGVFSLGDDAAGNQVVASSYTQTSGGSTTAYLSSVALDLLELVGSATLAGELELRVLGTPPVVGSGNILTYGSLVGAFDTATGFSDLGNGMWMSLTYGANALTGTIQLIGDLNGDGFVGLDDLDIVLNHWNQSVSAGVGMSGDPSGDGFVGLDDLDLVLNNWNNGTPPIAPANIPEPGTLSLLAVGIGALVGRRRGSKARVQCDGTAEQSSERSKAMGGRMRYAAVVLATLTAGWTGMPAGASVIFEMAEVDNSAALTGYTTYDLNVTTDTDWTSAGMLLELTAGSVYQHEFGGITGPANPAFVQLFPDLAFDTHVAGSTAGGAGDLGGTGLAFGTDRLDVSWFNNTPGDTGTTTIGRITLTDDAAGTMSLMTQSQLFDITLSPGIAPTITEVIEELPPPTGPVETTSVDVQPYVAPAWYGLPDWMSGDTPLRYTVPTLYDGTLRTDDPRTLNYGFNLWTPIDKYDATLFNRHDPSLRSKRFTIPDTTEDTTTDQATLPEPATAVILTTCLGLSALRRR